MTSGPTMRPRGWPARSRSSTSKQMCQPAAPIAMNRRSMLCQSVSRVPPRSQRLQFPADLVFAPGILERPRRVRSLHLGLGNVRRRRSHRRERCSADGTEVPVRIERSPFAQMLGVRNGRPNLRRSVGQVANENERPLLSIPLDLSARSGSRRVRLTAAHVLFPFTEGTFSIFSKCCSRATDRAPSTRTARGGHPGMTASPVASAARRQST
jgi:hypothetical protein